MQNLTWLLSETFYMQIIIYKDIYSNHNKPFVINFFIIITLKTAYHFCVKKEHCLILSSNFSLEYQILLFVIQYCLFYYP